MISIFTPTYNRAKTLPRLYNSLKNQTNQNFEWVIVDDGSSDNTEELVSNWINEKNISITYYKQVNGGKHRAINKGLDLAEGELFFIVDSDDYLTTNSIEYINSKSKNLDTKIIGIAPRRKLENENFIGEKFPQDEFVSDHIEKTYNLNLKGDLAEVVKTEILKKFKFPDFNNEKFCAESLLWNRLANNGYKLLFTNEPIYVGEYLDGGLTANSLKNRRKSPTYATLLYKELAKSKKLSVLQKFRANINYWRFAPFTNKTLVEHFHFLGYNPLSILAYPVGLIIKIKDDKSCS